MKNKKDSYLLKVLLFALSDPNFGERMKCFEKQIKEEKEKSKKENVSYEDYKDFEKAMTEKKEFRLD